MSRREITAIRWMLPSACVFAAIVALGTAGRASAASPISWSAPEQVLPGLVRPSWEPPQNATELDGVACPSAELCVAVDNQGDIVTSTDPTGPAATWHRAHIKSAVLEGVTCQSPTLCVAWGAHAIESSAEPAAAGAWTPTTIASRAKIDTVSCPEASLCLAITGSNTLVSSSDPGAGESAKWNLAVRHIDTSYSRRFGDSTVTALACPSVRLCVAVDSAGRVLASTHPTQTTRWSVADVDPRVVPDVFAPAVDASLTAISCPSAGFCTAVDEYGQIAYSSDPTGGAGAWTLTNRHPFYLHRVPSDVSCGSVSLCAYVGSEALSSYSPGSVRVLSGPANVKASYSTRRINDTYLGAVACAPTSICVAVGDDASLVVGSYTGADEERPFGPP